MNFFLLKFAKEITDTNYKMKKNNQRLSDCELKIRDRKQRIREYCQETENILQKLKDIIPKIENDISLKIFVSIQEIKDIAQILELMEMQMPFDEDEYEELIDEAIRLGYEIEQLNDEIYGEIEQPGGKIGEIDRLTSKLDQIAYEKDSLYDKNVQALEDNAPVVGENNLLIDKIDEIKGKIDKLNDQNRQLVYEFKQLCDESRRLTSEINQLIDELNQLTDRSDLLFDESHQVIDEFIKFMEKYRQLCDDEYAQVIKYQIKPLVTKYRLKALKAYPEYEDKNNSRLLGNLESFTKDEIKDNKQLFDNTRLFVENTTKNNVIFDLEKSLLDIIGLESVKEHIRRLRATVIIAEERRKMGLSEGSQHTLHMIFKGNPGTGKTMIARIVANLLHSIGVIKTNKLVETDRSGLVGEYVGQTAIKTANKVQEALDGVLFIDEAYALSEGGNNDFGIEAISTLVKLIDDNRGRLVVILAGYSKSMDTFLLANDGLKSRFPNTINFEDYNSIELMLICEKLLKEQQYLLTIEAKEKLVKIFEEAVNIPAFGNGRYVRNLVERSIAQLSYRLVNEPEANRTREKLMEIQAEDIVGVQM